MAVTVAEETGAMRGRVAAPAKSQLWLGSAGRLAYQAAWFNLSVVTASMA